MGTFRNLTFLLLFIAIAINVEGRVHKRRFLSEPKDDLSKVNVRRGKFFLPQPAASGGSPTCIITRKRRSIQIDDENTQSRQAPVTPTPPVPPVPPPVPPPPSPPPPPPPPAPPTPTTPPPVVPPPPPPPPPPPINCIIVDKGSPSSSKPFGRILDSDDDEVVSELKSASTANNHRRRKIQTRQKIRQIFED